LDSLWGVVPKFRRTPAKSWSWHLNSFCALGKPKRFRPWNCPRDAHSEIYRLWYPSATAKLFSSKLSIRVARFDRGPKKRAYGKINSAAFNPSQGEKTRLAIQYNRWRVLVLL
jgi:hypothetical protein